MKNLLGVCWTSIVLLFISMHASAQMVWVVKDRVRIDLNPPKGYSNSLRDNIRFSVGLNFVKNCEPAELNLVCNDSLLFVISDINVLLVSGTSWENNNPPKKPFLFGFKLLFGSKDEIVVDRFNYLEFLSKSNYGDKIAYEMIKRVEVCMDVVMRNNENCATIEYELVPDSLHHFNGLRIERVEIK